MKDWRGIAKAVAPDISSTDLDRVDGPLKALESIFRPLVKDLPPELEPALAFRAGEEDE